MLIQSLARHVGLPQRHNSASPQTTPSNSVSDVVEIGKPTRSKLVRHLQGIALAGLMIPAAIGAALTATPAFAQSAPVTIGKTVEVNSTDVLRVRAVGGDTMFGIARHFTDAETAVPPYAGELEQKNHSTNLKIGQTVALPITSNASPTLREVIAAQKGYGFMYAGLEWQAATVDASEARGYDIVSVPSVGPGGRNSGQDFYVKWDLQDQITRFQVWTPQDAQRAAKSADPLAGAAMGQMLFGANDILTITVPEGTTEVLFNDSETRNDGSIIAFGADGKALQMQANWNGHATAHAGTLVHDSDGLRLSVPHGTQHIEIRKGEVHMLNGHGDELAVQPDAAFHVGDGPVE